MSLRFSQDLQQLLIKLTDRPLAIAEILRQTGKRGFCLVICILVLPFLLPMPPGLSGIMGAGCLILGLQMALGRKSPWLPRKIAKYQLPRSLTRQLLKLLRRLSIWLSKLVRSRCHRISKHPSAWRITGFCIAWLSILLMLPIPFTNPLPATAILLLAIATLENDGVMMFLGYGLTFLNTLIFASVGYALWQIPHLLPNFLTQ